MSDSGKTVGDCTREHQNCGHSHHIGRPEPRVWEMLFLSTFANMGAAKDRLMSGQLDSELTQKQSELMQGALSLMRATAQAIDGLAKAADPETSTRDQVKKIFCQVLNEIEEADGRAKSIIGGLEQGEVSLSTLLDRIASLRQTVLGLDQSVIDAARRIEILTRLKED